MSSPSPVQIREANAHLSALHRRVADLERRLEEAERTARGHEQSLIRKEQQLRETSDEIRAAKDREVALLQEQLSQSQESVQTLSQTLKEKEQLIGRLQHRCHLLDSICKSRPLLDGLLVLMAEAEPADHGEPAPSNHTHFSLNADESDEPDEPLDGVVFGTTV